jgi:molecular chaperone GrpE
MNTEEKNDEAIDQDETPETANEATNGGGNAEQKLREELLYLRADFDNVKRRMLREQDNAIRFANEKVFGELLTIVDLFDRAMASGAPLKNNEEAKSFFTGIEMTHRELVHLLSRFGVELTGSVGEKFDPSRHEAISQAPVAADKVDTVIAVVQRGCSLQGRMLKPAKVVVGIAQ